MAATIEVPRVPVVEELLGRGFRVFSCDPKRLDRFKVAGAKDDRLDARVLADALRTDGRLAYDFSGAALIVDVGGGQGRLLAEVLSASGPGARGVLLDLPAVAAGARPLLAAAGVADRCEVAGGDMFASVPAGGDLPKARPAEERVRPLPRPVAPGGMGRGQAAARLLRCRTV